MKIALKEIKLIGRALYKLSPLICLLLCITFESHAVKERLHNHSTQPRIESTLGIYITSIYGLDLLDNTFNIDFWAWWLASDPKYDPAKHIEISNARKTAVVHEFAEMIGDRNRTEAHFSALVNNYWDLTHFPFDRQTLTIVLEDANLPISDLIFTPDSQNSGLAPDLTIEGWHIENFKVSKGRSVNQTNFGDPRRAESTVYSHIKATLDIKRKGLSLYFNYFIGLFIASFLCFSMYFVNLEEIDTRIGLQLAAIFAVIGNKYIVDGSLPTTFHISLSDKLHIGTFIVVVISVVGLVLNQKLAHTARESLALTINKYTGAIVIPLYILFVVGVTYHSYAFG